LHLLAFIFWFGQVHSSLLLWPVDRETGNRIEGRIRSLMYGHVTQSDLSAAPTENWFANITEFLASAPAFEIFFTRTQDLLSTVVAASSGAIAIMPDCTSMAVLVDSVAKVLQKDWFVLDMKKCRRHWHVAHIFFLHSFASTQFRLGLW
jgi:hypothetical protein